MICVLFSFKSIAFLQNCSYTFSLSAQSFTCMSLVQWYAQEVTYYLPSVFHHFIINFHVHGQLLFIKSSKILVRSNIKIILIRKYKTMQNQVTFTFSLQSTDNNFSKGNQPCFLIMGHNPVFRQLVMCSHHESQVTSCFFSLSVTCYHYLA